MRAAGTQPLPRLRARARELPRELETVAHRALAFFPRFRYRSMDELAADLERFLEGERIHARPARPHERALELWAAHRRGAAVLASAVLLALAALLVWYGRRAGEQELLLRRMNAVVIPWLDGDLAGARSALASLEELHPDPPLGGFLAALAAGDLERASDDPATRALLEGERARRAGRAREALERFYTASDLRPGYPLALLFQGLAALDAGELEIAREKLEHVAHYYGPALAMHRTLAALYARLGLHADACRALNAALALAPDDAATWLDLARARLELGDAPAVLEAARRAGSLDAQGSRAELALLASTLEERGAPDEAAALRAELASR